MKAKIILWAMGCIMLTWIAACSSSPGSGTVNGVFADTNVVGMSYTCGSQSAVTGAGGTFACPSGNVTFKVGGITICNAPAQAFMTPLSCAQATTPSATTATPSVLAITRFLLSISTTPASSGSLTITSAELQAAANLSVDFSTATDPQLLAAVDAIVPGAALVDPVTAQNELIATVNTSLAGNYSGTFSGGSSGTWSVTIASDGSVSGSGSGGNGNFNITGSVVSGSTFSGTAGSATWTGTLDTSKSPVVFSGTWSDPNTNGTFTGTKH